MLFHLHRTAREQKRRQRRHRAREHHRRGVLVVGRSEHAERINRLKLHGGVGRVQQLRKDWHRVHLQKSLRRGWVAGHVPDGHGRLALCVGRGGRELSEQRHVPSHLQQRLGGRRVVGEQVAERSEAHRLCADIGAEKQLPYHRGRARAAQGPDRCRHERSVGDGGERALLHVRQVRLQEGGERRHGARLGEHRSEPLVSGELRDRLHCVVRCVLVRVQERDEAGQPTEVENGGTQMRGACHGGEGSSGRSFGEAIGRGEHGDQVWQHRRVLQLRGADGAVVAEVAERNGGVGLELLVGVLEQREHRLQAAALYNGSTLLRIRGKLRERRQRLQL
mmetsp:Transcript_33283/g.77805  ORF Transcript_33283/g.77805 Transcript_33283/m.77805 type:complete len:335 (-) Transcript_33283:1732-2736(-)